MACWVARSPQEALWEAAPDETMRKLLLRFSPSLSLSPQLL